MQIAYAITAHRNASQLQRLLSAIYTPRDLYIVHVDKRAPEVRAAALEFAAAHSPNVHVIASKPVIWAGWSQTRTQLAMMSHALWWCAGSNGSRERWDYFINLSGQDYPLRSPEQIRTWLADRGPNNNYMQVLDYDAAPPDIQPRMRYVHLELGSRVRRLKLQRAKPKNLHLHWGSSWFVASRAFCALAVSSPQSSACRRAIRFARSSDEIFFQSLLMNSPLRETLVNDCRRLVLWEGGSHPRTLTMADQQAILGADAFFARKFDAEVDLNVMDFIDDELLESAKSETLQLDRTIIPSLEALDPLRTVPASLIRQ